MWYNEFETLNLLGGKIFFIGDELEDMIEIRYTDGMLIDVGKYSSIDMYCITVVASDDENGWGSPLLELPVSNRSDLFKNIQETIKRFRC